MTNSDYANRLDEIADLLQVKGENPFKVRAIQRASRAIRNSTESIEEHLDAATATEIPGIGQSIAADLTQIRQRNSCDRLDELRNVFPAGIGDLLKIQGLGPKKVKKLYDSLGITDVDSLEVHALAGNLANIDGFGQRTEEQILVEIDRLHRFGGRTPLAHAYPHAVLVLSQLRALTCVEQAEMAGSLRRGRESVRDLDFVVASEEPEVVMDAFVTMAEAGETIVRGSTKTSVFMTGGIQADLRVVPPDVFGATLHHFTGSKEHNIKLRSRALKRGLKISEWGVFELDDKGQETNRLACTAEEDIYEAVGLPFIPPPLRENRGEIEAAEAGKLPKLLELTDVRSDLHLHTVASDGRNTIEEMARAASLRGLEYIAITDHSQSLTIANGLSPESVLKQIAAIDAYNASQPAVRVLKGLEVDILPNGDLDMASEVLQQLDWVIGSIHLAMRQPSAEMTDRLLKAIHSGLISTIGHPTGRIIGGREPIQFEIDTIFDACSQMNVALELNASPERLDINGTLLKRALQRAKLWIAIGTDAHAVEAFHLMHFGVRMAQRGWVPKDRVLNALSFDEFMKTRRAPGPSTT